MGREGIDLSFQDPGTDIESLRKALIEMRAELDRRDFAFMRILQLQASNISITAGSPTSPVGTIGRDPQSQNIWGFIAERGYGFHARYQRANYARFFVDAGNDSGHSTPSSILDMPSPNKMVFKDNGGFTIMRLYGRGGQEVGNAANYFNAYGAVDLFCPIRLFQFDFNGGTAGGPEGVSDAAFSQEGFIYQRLNYGATGNNDIRVFNAGTWRSIHLFHPEEVSGSPFVADNVAVRESVTVTIT